MCVLLVVPLVVVWIQLRKGSRNKTLCSRRRVRLGQRYDLNISQVVKTLFFCLPHEVQLAYFKLKK